MNLDANISQFTGEDIVDEAIKLFRANVFFKHFDLKSPADRILVYLTFYINLALKRLEGCRTVTEGTYAIKNLNLEHVHVPGESGFPFHGIFPRPTAKKEAGKKREIDLNGQTSDCFPSHLFHFYPNVTKSAIFKPTKKNTKKKNMDIFSLK